MHRRTYVASLAPIGTLAATSGCLRSALGRRTDGAGERTVTVSTVERPNDLELAVSVPDAEIDPDSTARVALQYRNPGDDVVTANLSPSSPDPLESVDRDPGLVLLSDAYSPSRHAGGCWKPEQRGFPRPAVVYRHPIAPGDRVSLSYDLWAAPHQDADCVRTGTYRFEPPHGSFALTVAAGERSD